MSETPERGAAAPAVQADHVIAVALIDDNRLVREGIVSLLGRYPDIRVAAAGHSARATFLQDADPEVILLDLGLENGDSLRVAKKVKKDFPSARIIIMDLLPVQEDIVEFISAGVSGFVMKDASLDEVVRTIRSVALGNEVLPTQMTSTLFSEIAREAVSNGGFEDSDSVRMTPREREVLDLIAEGLSNKAIAKRLHISTHTVKSHVRNIMEKLTLHTRLQLAVYAHGERAP